MSLVSFKEQTINRKYSNWEQGNFDPSGRTPIRRTDQHQLNNIFQFGIESFSKSNEESSKFLMLMIHSPSGGVYGAAMAALFEPPAGMAPLWYAFRLMGINAGFCGKMCSLIYLPCR